MTSEAARQQDQLWSVDGLAFPASDFWTTMQRGATEETHETFYDGGNREQEVQVTDAKVGDFVIGRIYRPADHRSLCEALDQRLQRQEKIPAVIKGLDTDSNLDVIGEVSTKRAFLRMIKWPDGDRNSKTRSTVELTFTVPTQ